MKKIILIGKVGSGKTTLIQKLSNETISYKKTQTILQEKYFIDTPGEYIENKIFLNGLIVSSYDSDIVGLVEDCTSNDKWLPPSFSSVFNKEVIGIITKSELGTDEQIENASMRLKESGCDKIFLVSSIENVGIDDLTEYLSR